MIFRTQDRPQTARARSVQPWDGAGKELALDLCYYSLAAGASDHPRLGPLGIACESCSGAGTGVTSKQGGQGYKVRYRTGVPMVG